MSSSIQKYYKTVNGRLDTLIQRVPSFRPLPKEAMEIIDSMSIQDRRNVYDTADALIDLLQAQINELKEIKSIAGDKPKFKVVG